MEKNRDTLHVRISEATKVLWEGEAKSVSSENADGSFDVLAMHSNFITLVRDKPITIITENGEEKKYTFNQSVIFVTDNEVKIFADIQ